MSCPWYLYLCHVVHGSILSISFTSSLSRYGGDLAVGAMTDYYKCQPACNITITGMLYLVYRPDEKTKIVT